MDELELKRSVRENYGAIARSGGSCCGASGCGCGSPVSLVTLGKEIGYTEEELTSVPEGANMGLGCGNPVALGYVRPTANPPPPASVTFSPFNGLPHTLS